MKLLKTLFSIYNDKLHKVICILGFKIKFKNSNNKLKQKINFLENNIKDLYSSLFIPFEPWISYSSGIKNGSVSNWEEHLKNIENLKKGLSDEDKSIIDNIQNKLTRLSQNKYFIPELIYNKEEYEEYLKACELISKIIKNKDKNYYELDEYKLPNPEFLACCFLHKNGLSKVKNLNSLDKDAALIDVGAFIGDSAIAFREFSDNPIICFEPLQSNYENTLKTIELNKINNIKVEKLALGDKNQECRIATLGGGAYIVEGNCDKQATETIISVRFDDYVKQNNLKVGLIKVDTEGFESPFLEGAKETICNQKPILLLSIYHNYHDFYKIKPWLESLNLGYKFSIFKGIDATTYPFYDIMLIAECN